MKFPDFLEFEPFNQLRHTMGANKLGAFEFFDAESQLSAYERMALEKGVAIPGNALRVLADKTLAWKNARIIVLQKKIDEKTIHYHLAECEAIKELLNTPEKLLVSTREPLIEDHVVHVCEHCLHVLNYSGFDAVRARHHQYAQRILQSFKLHDYFKAYPSYPITDKKESPLF